MDFIFDLDGTICFDGKNIPQKIIKALKKASEYGHEVSFASARSYRDCLPVLKDDFKNNTVIALNGTCVFKNGELVDYKVIDEKSYSEIMKLCLEYDAPYFVDDYMNYSFNKADKISFFKYVDINMVARSLVLAELTEPVKVVVFVEDSDELRDRLFDLGKKDTNLEMMYHEEEKAIYINPGGINKATSIINDISNNYIAFGNDKNDIEMFKKATYAVQIGNYEGLTSFADETISVENLEEKIAAKIIELFKKY